MKEPVNLLDIPNNLKPLVDEVVSDMNRKLKRSKKPLIKKEDLQWSYDWAQRIDGNGDIHKNLLISLNGSLGRRKSNFIISTSSNKDVPKEVMQHYDGSIVEETVDSTIDHITTFYTKSAKLYVTGGYEKIYNKETRQTIVITRIDGENKNSTNNIFTISGTTVYFSFFLNRRFQDKLDSIKKGDTFKYGYNKYRKLTDHELISLCGNRLFSESPNVLI